MIEPGIHDVGGLDEGPIDRAEHGRAFWEQRVDALQVLLSDPKRPGGQLMTVDELRRGIESLGREAYDSLSYYERWISSITQREARRNRSARASRMRALAPGSRVRVRAMYPPGHLRVPRYARGKTGTIERVCGGFENPERLAYGKSGDLRTLYRVRFAHGDLFDSTHHGDTIDIEIYDHWLELL